ncbi:MAG: ABC transporter ATP-binding protein, partial [Bdellovibrionaceae bacterium]|nr:ABC transporter ATP-binding protein [Pseudobdellovibrionaceae bacterium]
ALRGVSFQVAAGKITALLGPNGAGKTTTMSLILGLRRPSFGKLLVFDRPPRDLEVRRKIGYASQELSFPSQLRVQEVLDFVAAHYQNTLSISEIARKFELDRLLCRQVGGLSGGEKRRLGLATALIHRPQLLVLDEPTTGLDIESRMLLWNEITHFAAVGGTVLLSTHDLTEVSRIANDVLLIDHGQIIFSGSLQQILQEIDLKSVIFSSLRPPPENLPGCVKLSAIGPHQWQVLCRDSDTFIQELVKSEVPFQGLFIKNATLEEAFLKLRGKES